MTQTQRLKDYLDKGNTITRLQAFEELGIVELSSRIGEIEHQGYPVKKERITVKNRFGEKVRVMRYGRKQ